MVRTDVVAQDRIWELTQLDLRRRIADHSIEVVESHVGQVAEINLSICTSRDDLLLVDDVDVGHLIQVPLERSDREVRHSGRVLVALVQIDDRMRIAATHNLWRIPTFGKLWRSDRLATRLGSRIEAQLIPALTGIARFFSGSSLAGNGITWMLCCADVVEALPGATTAWSDLQNKGRPKVHSALTSMVCKASSMRTTAEMSGFLSGEGWSSAIPLLSLPSSCMVAFWRPNTIFRGQGLD